MKRAVQFIAIALAAAVACKSTEKAKPLATGLPVVASCDYTSETLSGTHHRCYEIFDPSSVDEFEHWCNGSSGPKNRARFARGKGCPGDGRNGGCLYPNGMIDWRYSGKTDCMIGQPFEDAPTIEKAKPYRCASERLCTEVMSVFDLTTTLEKSKCEDIPEAHNKFERGSCSAENVSARCVVRDRWRETTWVFYRPYTVDEVKQNCDEMKGTFASP